MQYVKKVKPISPMKAHAAEVVQSITGQQEAMLKLLVQSTASREQGKFKPFAEAFADIEKRIKAVFYDK